MGHGFSVRQVAWQAEREALMRVRHPVFVVEQGVPPEMEMDEFDPCAVHVLAQSPDGAAIGCGRLLPDGRIGRMAVLPAARGRGVGDALLRALLDAARMRGDAEVFLHAQTRAVGFYARHGFEPEGPEFDEAGIAHQTMRLPLARGG